MTAKKLFPLGGIVFVVATFLIVAVLGGSTPNTNASADRFFTYYDAHSGRQVVAAFLMGATVPFLVFFGVSLAAGHGGTRSFWELVVLIGTALAATGWLVAALLHFALADAPGNHVSPDAVKALGILDGDFWIAANAALGVLMLGAAGTMLERRVRWLGWPALAIGIALFVPFADFAGLLLTGVWIITAGVVLAREAGEPAPMATRREAIASA
jgi:hypothetical protein